MSATRAGKLVDVKRNLTAFVNLTQTMVVRVQPFADAVRENVRSHHYSAHAMSAAATVSAPLKEACSNGSGVRLSSWHAGAVHSGMRIIPRNDIPGNSVKPDGSPDDNQCYHRGKINGQRCACG